MDLNQPPIDLVNERPDIRKIPLKNWVPLGISAKVEGKWISFYDSDKKVPLNTAAPYAKEKPKGWNHKRSSSFSTSESSQDFLDAYQLHKLRKKQFKDQQKLKLIPTNNARKHSTFPITDVCLTEPNLFKE